MYDQFNSEYLEILPHLRKQIIHNDGNDYNIIMNGSTVSGIIDFGDVTHSALVNNIGITLAYCCMGKAEPILAASHVLKGYISQVPLRPDEIEILPWLVVGRLCHSLCSSTHRRGENAYINVSEKGAWALLRKLAEDQAFVKWKRSMRVICGLGTSPSCGEEAAKVLRNNAEEVGPVIKCTAEVVEPLILDFSGRDRGIADASSSSDPSISLARKVADVISAKGVKLAFGKYGENRVIYNTGMYQVASEEEARTFHLGLDIFSAAGTEICCPLENTTVHSFADNNQPGDYGPCIILRHEFEGCIFYSLYGHLSRDSLKELSEGQALSRGQVFAKVGDYAENGQWPPHLHLQIIGNISSSTKHGDFPGVCKLSEAAKWMSNCPDPNLLLKVKGL